MWAVFVTGRVGSHNISGRAMRGRDSFGPSREQGRSVAPMLNGFRQIMSEEIQKSGGKRKFALSVESPPNEFFMPHFHVCDERIVPPGHTGYGHDFFPLYNFLYHEFVLIQGGFGLAPEPFHMPIRNAYNLVMGEIPGGVITGDGLLLNRDTFNWAPWRPPIGDNEDSLAMLRSTIALRRGKGGDYLVYGRMQRPTKISGIKLVHWEAGGQAHSIPAVFHAAWESPQKQFAVVLANWTKQVQVVSLSDSRLEKSVAES